MEENAINFIPLTERPRPTIFAATGLALLGVVGLWIATLLAMFIQPRTAAGQELFTSVLYYLPFTLLPAAVCILRHEGISDGLRLNPMPFLPTATVILLALVCVYAASAVDSLWVMLLHLFGLHEPETTVAAASSAGLTLQIIGTAAVPAVCEELLFRGMVFSAFERRGTRSAIWVSAALFALMHGNLFGLPAYFLMGAISAFIVYALDSLYAGMLFHTVYNTAILVLMYMIAGQGDAIAQQAGALSAISIALDMIMVGLMTLTLLLTLNARRRAAGIEPVPPTKAPLLRKERWMLGALIAVMAISIIVVQALTEAGL